MGFVEPLNLKPKREALNPKPWIPGGGGGGGKGGVVLAA